MKRLVWFIIICAGLFFAAGSANAQDGSGEFHLARKNGYDVTASIQVMNGKLKKISYSEWTPINRSAHECGIEGSRGDADTKWTDRGNTTTISTEDDDPGALTVTKRADGLVVQSRCNDLKILFAWRNGKYFGSLIQ
jgi:hypothetical protein